MCGINIFDHDRLFSDIEIGIRAELLIDAQAFEQWPCHKQERCRDRGKDTELRRKAHVHHGSCERTGCTHCKPDAHELE